MNWFAQQADLSLICDAAPPGTFNYTDDREYTPAEAVNLLNTVLLTKGYTLIRRERLLMVLNLKDGVPPNLVSIVPVEELDKRGESELVSVLFPLEKLTPEEAEQEVQKLLGPQGSVVVLSKSRHIQVTETAGRLRTIRRVIEALESPLGHGGQVKIFPLKFISPDEALPVLRQLLDIPADKNASADGSIRLMGDVPGRRILASGRPDKLARIAEMLDTLDVAGPGLGAGRDRLDVTPQLEVYPVVGVSPESALQVIQTLMTGMPDVRLSLDSKSGTLIAMARPSQHATIRATLEQFQRDARRVEVFQLQFVDPQTAVSAISKLFSSGPDSGALAPTVDASPTGRQLFIRATEAQIKDIKSLLRQMGETGMNDPGYTDQRNVRVLPLTGRAARSVLQRIQDIWPTMRGNKIQVVTPVSPITSVRPNESPDAAAERTARPGPESPQERPWRPRGPREGMPPGPPRMPLPDGTSPGPPADVSPEPAPGQSPSAKPSASNPAEPAKPSQTVPQTPGKSSSTATPAVPKSAQSPSPATGRPSLIHFAVQLQAKPAEAKPAEAKPAEAKPAVAKPAEQPAKPAAPSAAQPIASPQTPAAVPATPPKQAEPKAAEVKPAVTKPVVAKSVQAKPAEATPAETKPAEQPAKAVGPSTTQPKTSPPTPVAAPAMPPKQAEAKPAEIKPAEAKPAEAKPTETKAAEAKPAEQPAKVAAPGAVEHPALQHPESAAPRLPPQSAPAPIIVSQGPGGLTIASQDVEALNAFESLLSRLAAEQNAGGREMTVFYLKHAKASVVAETLEQILAGGGLGSSGFGGSVFGGFGGGPGGVGPAGVGPGGRSPGGPSGPSGMTGRGALGSMLGSGRYTSTGPIQITPDSRLNALVVNANSTDLDTVEELLKVLDQKGSPEDVLTEPKPRLIPVFNTQAEEIAQVVRQVYQDRMASSGQGFGPPMPGFMMAMQQQVQQLAQQQQQQGGTRGSRRGRSGSQREDTARLSIGVDSRTNSLIVAAPEALFEEVRELVEQLDQGATQSNQVLRVVTLQRASPTAVEQALSSLMGQSVQMGRGSSSGPGSSGGSSGGWSQRRSFGGSGFFGGQSGFGFRSSFGGGGFGGFGGGGPGGFGGGGPGGFGGGGPGPGFGPGGFQPGMQSGGQAGLSRGSQSGSRSGQSSSRSGQPSSRSGRQSSGGTPSRAGGR